MRILERYHAVLAETEAIKRNEEAQALTLVNESTPSYPAALMAPTLLVGTDFDPTTFVAQHPGPVLPSFGQLSLGHIHTNHANGANKNGSNSCGCTVW